MGTPFRTYFQLQKLALRTIWDVNPAHKLLEDYLSMIPDLSVLKDLNDEQLRNRFKDTVHPLITIAGNNGFEGLFEHRYLANLVSISQRLLIVKIQIVNCLYLLFGLK